MDFPSEENMTAAAAAAAAATAEDASKGNTAKVEEEGNNSSSKKICENGDEENADDGQMLADALMENFNANMPQYDVDNMMSNLMESAAGDGLIFDEESKGKLSGAEVKPEKREERSTTAAIDSEKRDAFNLLAQGKRNMFIKDYESAVSTLGEACQKLNSIYGEFAIELGDAYLTYGNALFELWRIEEAEKQSANHESNDQKPSEDIAKNVAATAVAAEASSPAAELLEKKKSYEDDDEDDEDDDDDDDDDNDNGENKKERNEEEEEERDEEEEEKEEDIENEEDNLQIAWEVIEIAKEIYIRHENDVNLSKAYTKLGEISIASGNYELAVEDLGKSLQIHEKLEKPDNRFVANTYFNLYVAYAALHNYDKSTEHLDKARKVFENLLDELREKLHKLDENELSEIAKFSSEIKDIELILRDMDSKILETSRNKREFMNALFEAIKNKTQEEHIAGQGSSSDKLCSNISSSSSSSSSLPVNNINHLIHKKPKQKAEESSQQQQQQTNGHQEVKFVCKSKTAGENSQNNTTNGKKDAFNGSNNGESSQLNVKEKKRTLEDVCAGNATKKVCFREEDASAL